MKRGTVGPNLLAARNRTGLTQTEAAKRLGFSTSHRLWRYEANEVNPPIEVLKKMAEVYGCTLDELLRGEVPASTMGAEDDACDGVERDLEATDKPRDPIAESAAR